MKKLLIVISTLLITSNILLNANTTDSLSTLNSQLSTESHSYVDIITDWYNDNMNYGTITALMTIESSFIPFPSEIIVPPAAAVSMREDSKLNLYLIILFATLGAIFGALINYFLSVSLGRAIIYKFADSRIGHLCLLSGEKIQKAEEYFNSKGAVATFIGRLIPGIRQLISIPAGLARMPLLPFIAFTALGAGIWNVILAMIGYIVGDNIDLINKYSHEIGYIILGIIALVALYYIAKKLITNKKTK